jgi:chaperonin GroEL
VRTTDQDAGIKIVRRAIQAPLRQIAGNAGVDGSVVVGKVIENDSPSFGFDAQAEEYGDMLKAGVIDPTKVVRIALENAASIAGLLITTEAMVAQKPEKAGAGSDMSDMGGHGRHDVSRLRAVSRCTSGRAMTLLHGNGLPISSLEEFTKIRRN